MDVYGGLFIIVKTWKEPSHPSIEEERIYTKLWYIHTVIIIQRQKEMSYQAIKIHGETLDAYY